MSGFSTDVAVEEFPIGLNEEVVKEISKRKDEPKFLLDWRLSAFSKWQKMETPSWAKLQIPKIDFQDIVYFAQPKKSVKKSR